MRTACLLRRCLLVAAALASAGLMLGAVAMAAGEGYSWAQFLTPSPDGSRIAFAADREDGGTSVLIIDEDGEVEGCSDDILPGDLMHTPGLWFPDGERLLIGRFRDAPGGEGERFFDAIVWAVADGRTESLSGGRGGLKRSFDAAIVSDNAVVLHAEAEYLGRAGLYLYRRTADGWQPRSLLADTAEWRWAMPLWAREDGGTLRVIVRSMAADGGDGVAFWEVEAPPAGEPRTWIVTGDTESLDGWDVATDGSDLAVVRLTRRPIRLNRRLALYPLGEGADGRSRIDCGRNVLEVDFSPRGDRLLLWSPGGVGRRIDYLAELAVLDLATREITPIAVPRLPADGPGSWLYDAAWLSDDALVLSYPQYGIARLDLETGSIERLWEETANVQ